MTNRAVFLKMLLAAIIGSMIFHSVATAQEQIVNPPPMMPWDGGNGVTEPDLSKPPIVPPPRLDKLRVDDGVAKSKRDKPVTQRKETSRPWPRDATDDSDPSLRSPPWDAGRGVDEPDLHKAPDQGHNSSR